MFYRQSMLFNYHTFNLPASQPLQKLSWVIGWTCLVHTVADISPIPPIILAGGRGEKVRNFASLFDPVAFDALWFENEATYIKPKTVIESANDRTNWVQSVAFESL